MIARRQRPGLPRPGVEHAHAAVIDKTQPVGGYARRHAQGMGHADAIPVLVDRAQMRCVLAFRVPADARYMRDLSRFDAGGTFGGIALVQQVVHGHVDEPGVAHILVLIDGRDLHGLGDDTNVFG